MLGRSFVEREDRAIMLEQQLQEADEADDISEDSDPDDGSPRRRRIEEMDPREKVAM